MANMFNRLKSLGHGKQDSEFIEYRSRIEMAQESLVQLKEHLDTAEVAWKAVASQCTHFVENFSSAYPDEDDMRNFSRETNRNLENLSRALTFSHSGKQWVAHEVVTDFLAECQQIDYKAVEVAFADVNKYSRKLDVLRRARSLDEERVSRNEEKFEAVRAAHDRVLQPTVTKMREVWSKVPIAFTAMYVAYWHAQIRAAALTKAVFDDPGTFVKEHEDRLASGRISTISEIRLKELIVELQHIGVSGKPVEIVSGDSLLGSPIISKHASNTFTKAASSANEPKDNSKTQPNKTLPSSPVAAGEDAKNTISA